MAKVFVVSFLVFIVLNVFETLIHYSIGRTHDTWDVKMILPTGGDIAKIIVVMLTFAILQATLTTWFS